MTKTHHAYFYSGLWVRSEWPIDDWASFERPARSPADITIRVAEPGFLAVAGDHRLEIPGIGSFVIREGSQIVVISERGLAMRELDLRRLNAFLPTVAWGALCYQRGLHLLHGSAVLVGAHAVAFSGVSGAGKSTLAAWLAARNYPVLVDDTCRLEVVNNQVHLHPSAPRLKLWGESLSALGRGLEDLKRVMGNTSKFHIPTACPSTLGPQPLGAVYLIGWGDFRLTRLTGAEALQSFLEKATYRPGLLRPLERASWFTLSAIQIVRRVPIFELSRPHDLMAMDDTIQLLESHWADVFA